MKDKVFWYEGKGAPRAALDANYSTDVVIVGGGMSGLMCAYALVRTGKSVIVVEKDFCGAGASGKSSGFISPDSELELSDLIANHGKEIAATLWNFVADGVMQIKDTISTFHIECDYQDQDSCYIATHKRSIKNFVREHDARESIGYSSILYDRKALQVVLGSHAFFGGVRYTGTFGINGFLFCQGLAKALERMGVPIFEQSPVTQVTKKQIQSGMYTVKADVIVLCTDRFLPDLGFLKPDVFQLQTFLAISEPLTEEEVKKIFPEKRMMVWDSKLIYNYFRITGDNRLLLGGANMWYTYTRKERHRVDQAVNRLDRFFRKKFPDIPIAWDYLWPGMVGVSKDVLPIAGQSREEPSHYYLVAATGLPWAAALGSYIANKITHHKTHPLDPHFSPYRRYPVGKGIEKIIGKPLSFLLAHFITKYFGKIV